MTACSTLGQWRKGSTLRLIFFEPTQSQIHSGISTAAYILTPQTALLSARELHWFPRSNATVMERTALSAHAVDLVQLRFRFLFFSWKIASSSRMVHENGQHPQPTFEFSWLNYYQLGVGQHGRQRTQHGQTRNNHDKRIQRNERHHLVPTKVRTSLSIWSLYVAASARSSVVKVTRSRLFCSPRLQPGKGCLCALLLRDTKQ